MTEDIVRRLSEIGNLDEGEAVKEVERVITTATGSPLTVKNARDTLTKMLGRVRDGEMQLIGRKAEDMAVMISLRDLATLISTRGETLSLGSALDEVGFVPIGRRTKLVARASRAPLRRPKTTSAGL